MDCLVSFVPIYVLGLCSPFRPVSVDDAQSVVDEYKTDPDLRIENASIKIGPGRGCFRVRFSDYDDYYRALFTGFKRGWALDCPYLFRFRVEEVYDG